MKAKFKRLQAVLMSVLSAFALVLTIGTSNGVCIFIAHQPEVPEALNKFRRYM